jgi:hypothetical protein
VHLVKLVLADKSKIVSLENIVREMMVLLGVDFAQMEHIYYPPIKVNHQVVIVGLALLVNIVLAAESQPIHA